MEREVVDPDFVTAWKDSNVHPVAAWNLWCIAQCESEPFSILEVENLLPPVAVRFARNNPEFIEQLNDRKDVLKDRLAAGPGEVITCTADEIVLRYLVTLAKGFLDDGSMPIVPKTLVEWMLTEECASRVDDEDNPLSSITDFEEVRELLTEDFDIDLLWDYRFDGIESDSVAIEKMGFAHLHPSEWFIPFREVSHGTS